MIGPLLAQLSPDNFDPRHGIFLIACLLGIVAVAAFTITDRLKRDVRPIVQSKAEKGDAGKLERVPGHWIPSDFKTPPATPYPDWDLTTTKPLPYRAFRYGPKYNVTMGLRSISFHDWIQLDNHYPKYYKDKRDRIADRGDKCCHTAPEAYPAALELLQELVEYMPARYPTLYKRTDTGILNLWSGEEINITERPLKEDPMTLCGRLTQDDLALMIEKPDGMYYLLAGSILLAGFWRLTDKFGMSLPMLHYSGEVPQYKEKLETGMLKFFARLRCEEIYSRNNYFIQVDDALPWSWSIGDEDSEGLSCARRCAACPRTGAVCFTIRTYFHPITEIAQEDYVPGRLASAVRSWGPDVSRYKGKERYGDVLLEYLDGEHQKQLDRGLDLEKEGEERQYPW
ncbi:alpha-1 2-mannosyltransferase [Apiospora hydei]|uniref:Alpha-1 2-mannosyltransferase n=1 Tax=Apiospora hydei TaxID=1337664 RepID=A0ABR1W7P0_9PEZI